MNDQRIRTRLSAYLEGDVSSREAARIESALDGSPELREELHGLQATLNLLRDLPRPDGPSALADRVMERVRGGEGSPVRWRDRLHRLFEPTFAVPLVASAAIAGAGALIVGMLGAVLSGLSALRLELAVAPGLVVRGRSCGDIL